MITGTNTHAKTVQKKYPLDAVYCYLILYSIHPGNLKNGIIHTDPEINIRCNFYSYILKLLNGLLPFVSPFSPSFGSQNSNFINFGYRLTYSLGRYNFRKLISVERKLK
jgi:hypothetical protein